MQITGRAGAVRVRCTTWHATAWRSRKFLLLVLNEGLDSHSISRSLCPAPLSESGKNGTEQRTQRKNAMIFLDHLVEPAMATERSHDALYNVTEALD